MPLVEAAWQWAGQDVWQLCVDNTLRRKFDKEGYLERDEKDEYRRDHNVQCKQLTINFHPLALAVAFLQVHCASHGRVCQL